MHKGKVHSWSMAILLAVVACDTSRVYEDYVDFEEAYWHVDSVQSFTFEIQDTNPEYNLFATFRNASTYPYYNLYFQYQLKDSSEEVIIEELKEIHLFDQKTGRPKGDGLGGLFDHQYLLENNYEFSRPGSYTLEFQQFMRMDTLPFLLSVGARVEKAEAR